MYNKFIKFTDEVKNASGNETEENNILTENVEKEDYNMIMITKTSKADNLNYLNLRH